MNINEIKHGVLYYDEFDTFPDELNDDIIDNIYYLNFGGDL